MNGVLVHLCAHIGWIVPRQENLMRMVRWMRWHSPPDIGCEIRALAVWGWAGYLSVTEAPHNIKSLYQSILYRVAHSLGLCAILQSKSKRQYLFTLKVCSYCLLALHGSIIGHRASYLYLCDITFTGTLYFQRKHVGQSQYNTSNPHDALKHAFGSPKKNLIFPNLRVLERQFSWNCFNNNDFIFHLPPTTSHLHPLQVKNCDSNSRLVVDEDDNGKFRPDRVTAYLKAIWRCS